MESTESTATIPIHLTNMMQPNIVRLNETSDNSTTSRVALIQPIIQQLMSFRPYIYPAIWSPYYFRTSSRHYQPYQQPYLMPLFRSNLYSDSVSEEETLMMAKNPFPIDDELSEEEALKELEAIKKEMAEDVAAKRHEERLILPSITINRDESSVTISLKNFASLIRSFSSRVTVTLATRTILVPNVSLKN